MADTGTIPVRRPRDAATPDPADHGSDMAPIVTRARVEHIMGMPISIHVRGRAADVERALPATEAVFDHLRLVDRVFSTYRADSDLMRLRAGQAEHGVHPWLREVVEMCLDAEHRTDGLFTAWLPSGGDARREFDPTGLVKGWGVQGAAEHLSGLSGVAYAINAAGDVVMGLGRDTAGVARPWRIGIEDPRDPTQVATVVERVTGAVATSGARARGAHVIDPRTGRGIAREGSATIDGPSLVWADVWATAAFVDPARVARLLPDRDPEYRLTLL